MEKLLEFAVSHVWWVLGISSACTFLLIVLYNLFPRKFGLGIPLSALPGLVAMMSAFWLFNTMPGIEHLTVERSAWYGTLTSIGYVLALIFVSTFVGSSVGKYFRP